MERGSVSINFVRKAVAALERRGRPANSVLTRSGIDVSRLDDDRHRVPAAQFSRLWLLISALLDDEFFALDSRRMKRGSFATMSRYTIQAGSLREAARRATTFVNLLLDDTQARLNIVGGTASLCVQTRADAGLPDPIFAQETLLIMLQGLLCWAIGRRIPIEQASFAYPRPSWWDEYQLMYCGELAFSAPQTALSFDAGQLDVPIVQNEDSIRAFLAQAPGNIILKYKDSTGCAVRIRRHLRHTPIERWPVFEHLAMDMHLTASTLRRRLEREGTSYREIKDSLRREVAVSRLIDSQDTLAQVATAVGFAEPSAFHRAFRQWTGVRPGDYRRTHGRRGGREPLRPKGHTAAE